MLEMLSKYQIVINVVVHLSIDDTIDKFSYNQLRVVLLNHE